MADNGQTADMDTEASQATQEQQVSHTLHDSHLQTIKQQKFYLFPTNIKFYMKYRVIHDETILA